MKIPIALHFINIDLRKHRFWGLYKWSKCYHRSRNSKFHFDQRLCWGRRRDRRRVKRCASWKTNIRDSTCNRELLECWSLFDNSGSEIRQSLSLVSKRFDKHSLQTKKQSNTRFFQKTKDFVILQGKDLRSILFQRSTSFLYPSSVKKFMVTWNRSL